MWHKISFVVSVYNILSNSYLIHQIRFVRMQKIESSAIEVIKTSSSQIQFSVIYDHVLAFYIIHWLTYFHTKAIERVKQKKIILLAFLVNTNQFSN